MKNTVSRWGAEIALASLILLAGCALIQPPATVVHPAAVVSQYPVGVLPDSRLTPGVVLPGITAQETCTGAYARGARNVPDSEKDQVYAAYRKLPGWSDLPVKRSGKLVEVDHDLPLTLGSENIPANLWIQRWHFNWNGYDIGAKTKDVLELKDHHLVCEGKLTLPQAQADFLSRPWIDSYKARVGALPHYVPSARP